MPKPDSEVARAWAMKGDEIGRNQAHLNESLSFNSAKQYPSKVLSQTHRRFFHVGSSSDRRPISESDFASEASSAAQGRFLLTSAETTA